MEPTRARWEGVHPGTVRNPGRAELRRQFRAARAAGVRVRRPRDLARDLERFRSDVGPQPFEPRREVDPQPSPRFVELAAVEFPTPVECVVHKATALGPSSGIVRTLAPAPKSL